MRRLSKGCRVLTIEIYILDAEATGRRSLLTPCFAGGWLLRQRSGLGLSLLPRPWLPRNKSDNSNHHKHYTTPPRPNLPPSDIADNTRNTLTYHIDTRDPPTRDRRLLITPLPSCETQPASTIKPARPCPTTGLESNASLFRPEHHTRLHSLPLTGSSRNDGQVCSRPGLSLTSH